MVIRAGVGAEPYMSNSHDDDEPPILAFKPKLAHQPKFKAHIGYGMKHKPCVPLPEMSNKVRAQINALGEEWFRTQANYAWQKKNRSPEQAVGDAVQKLLDDERYPTHKYSPEQWGRAVRMLMQKSVRELEAKEFSGPRLYRG